jgi:hypothetical protein
MKAAPGAGADLLLSHSATIVAGMNPYAVGEVRL